MSRPKGSKNQVVRDPKVTDEVVHDIYLLVKFIAALMANPNVYPKNGDAAIIAMAERMIAELDK